MSQRFSGGSQIWDEPAFAVKGSNISADRETGIGYWSADDFKRAMIDGVRPNGGPLAPQMPFAFYKILTPRRSRCGGRPTSVPSQPVRNEVQPPVYKAAMHASSTSRAAKSRPPMTDCNDPLKRGFYLATIAHCMECHSRKPDGTPDYKGWLGQGRAPR